LRDLPQDNYYKLMLKELKNLGKGISKKYFFMELEQEAFDNLEVIVLVQRELDKACLS